MEPYQQRVVDEKRELDEKLDKLIEFVKTDAFKLINSEEQGRLKRQLAIMEQYSMVLSERIVHF